MESLFHVLYVSRTARDLRTEEVQTLVAQANQRNWLRGLTGALAGGACGALHRRTPVGVLALRTLQQLAPAVQAWRDAPRAA